MATEISQAKREALRERITRITSQKKPIETGITPALKKLPDIRAVLFDVYGTIMISGSEPNLENEGQQEDKALQESWEELGLKFERDAPQKAVELLHRLIDDYHHQKKKEGVDCPEVDIIEIWEEVIHKLNEDGDLSPLDESLIPDMIVEFVIRYDKPWPMPGLEETLKAIHEKNLQTGIISNSQFYSPISLEAFFGKTIEEIGFNSELNFFSFEEEIAKPSVRFYEIAKLCLTKDFNIQPHQVLFVGNDMLKDVYPAQKAGFRTAFFAGDKRSLRLREDEERCKNLNADLVITHLTQIPDCLE